MQSGRLRCGSCEDDLPQHRIPQLPARELAERHLDHDTRLQPDGTTVASGPGSTVRTAGARKDHGRGGGTVRLGARREVDSPGTRLQMTICRRFLIGVMTLALVASCLSSANGQGPRVYRIGVVLQGGPYAAAVDGLRDGLKQLDLEEGKHYLDRKSVVSGR